MVDRGPGMALMNLALHVDPHETIDLVVNDQWQAHISVGVTDTRDLLQAQVAAACALRRLAWAVERLPTVVAAVQARPDHAEPTVARRLAAFWRGFVAGLEGATVPHPGGPLVPPLPPESSRSYDAGYQEGQACRRCLMTQREEHTPSTTAP